jgi:3-methyladenine DNA glycosylase/8-oxoguanine DNA glycosylase
MATVVELSACDDFDFRSTVYSHGWSELEPFRLDTAKWRLTYTFRVSRDRAFSGDIFSECGVVKVVTDAPQHVVPTIERDTRHILRLDDDLGEFYRSIASVQGLSWVAAKGAGRLLRSPTVFEDLIKTICTTNCSWALTKTMVGNLVTKLGTAAHGPERSSRSNAFPTPEAMASVDAGFYRKEVRAGYRSPYLVELAETVASGRLDPEAWLSSDLPTGELKREIKKLKGVGDYAAENLLKLLGRYDGLALDSWLRSQFYKKHNGARACDDAVIEQHYADHGRWRGLAMWCDMTEKWIV